jgi:hypothetical protein
MVAIRSLPTVVLLGRVLLGLAAIGASLVGCTTGTTPVCDDAGSCLILAPEASVDVGVVEGSAESAVAEGSSVDGPLLEAAAGGDGGDAGDAPAE